MLATVTPAPDDAAEVRLVTQQARWTGPGQPEALGDDREPWFLISGEIENGGRRPLAYVRLTYELLADGQVVAREMGYNRRAEALRDPAVESGAVAAATLQIPPLAAGERDGFRMIFLRGAAPRFDAWRVHVDAAPPPQMHGSARRVRHADGTPTIVRTPSPVR